ncbi:uncharacterized protein [Montipora foliosa]|uniref:uncharacterized protein n=1 Tax=Montipora foliosa TaxID=591990 RepID=UPI0035F10DA2
MHNWWWCLSFVVLICYTESVQSQSSELCYSVDDCNSGKCCRRTRRCLDYGSCRCEDDTDCELEEECGSLGYCFTKFSSPTQTNLYSCFSDYDCATYKTCEDGKCIQRQEEEEGAFGSRMNVGIIILMLTVACTASCICFLCRKARRQPAVRVPLPLTTTRTVALERNGQEMRSETTPAHATVIVVGVLEDSSVPSEGPPPYNSLEFNSSNLPPEHSPPSYDEAVRNSGISPT